MRSVASARPCRVHAGGGVTCLRLSLGRSQRLPRQKMAMIAARCRNGSGIAACRRRDVPQRDAPRHPGRQESDGSALTWIRAGFARIHRTPEFAAWLEAQGNAALAGIRPQGFPEMTRQRWRVSTQNRRLAGVFAIAFARKPSRRVGGIPARIPFDSTAYACEGRCHEPVITRGLRGRLIVRQLCRAID